MLKRIECVPNISEGRRFEVIDAICAAVQGVPGVRLLDRSSDADHNRTVLTMIGAPEGLTDAVMALFAVALDRIDLRGQRGRHPRIGAVDVVPFVPLRNTSMSECVVLATQVAAAVAERFSLPVYLYAAAATRPDRAALANIRRGEFEGLGEKMAQCDWQPDFGPTKPHRTAGAAAFGARPLLIAYNLLLDTPDVAVAQAIARAVRATSRGLPHVQAMGIYLDSCNRAQVSMNILNYLETPLYVVQERVKSEAVRYGARVVAAEVVGLIPQAALIHAAGHYLQITSRLPGAVLEHAIAVSEQLADETVTAT